MCLILLTGCPSKPSQSPRQPAEGTVFEKIPRDLLPDFQDQESTASLRSALEKSLAWYMKASEDTQLSWGHFRTPVKVMRQSMEHFVTLLDSGRLNLESISQDFDIFRVVPQNNSGKMLVTGYYEPVIEASLEPGGKFRWPIYPVPSDLLIVDLDSFGSKFHGERLMGRLEKNRVVPYYSRAEIDGKKVLEKPGSQTATPIAWLADPVDCFFLHIQGSGVITLPDGRQERVGYAGHNGRPYYSIGKDLIESGAVSRDEMSLQAIRKYLCSNPEIRNEIMWKNESYVFFKRVEQGPLGSFGTVLTAGRSIAADPAFHPAGGLAFLVSEKPVVDGSGEIRAWERFGRWVLNQDTGGAIKGPGRIDLFCGTGESAERIAGPMKQPGELYYLIKKGLVGGEQP
jgi:membrane-bound lytic murein transglycosylase A